MRILALVASAALAALAAPASGVRQQEPRSAAPDSSRTPWRVGERLEYNVKFGLFNVGRGAMEVLEIDTIRGTPVFHVLWTIQGRALMYSLTDSLESWFGVDDLASRRFRQNTRENSRHRLRTYEIHPEQRFWVRDGTDTAATVEDPLDDASFFFFARTLEFQEDRTYTFHRYFIEDRNPVSIRVLGRQSVNTPVGRFQCIALRPIFRSRGMFGQGGQAIIWFSDDERRIPVKVRGYLPVGTLEMQLRSWQ